MRKIILVIGIALSMVVVPGFATAQTIVPSLSVSPSKYQLAAIPGQLQQTVIKITNRSTVALPVTVEIMDFAPKDEKGAIDYGQSLPGHSAKDWFSIRRPDMILEAGETQAVEIGINPPENLADGSYFAVVMFKTNLPSNYIDEAGTRTQIVPWIGTLFLMSKGEPQLTDKDLTITRFAVPRFSTQNNIPVTLEVANNTKFSIAPEAAFELKSVFGGKVVAKANTEETTIMPGSKRVLTAQLQRQSPLGLYIPSALLEVAGLRKAATSQPLYLLTWAGLLIIAAVIIFHYMAIRHHRVIRHAVRRHVLQRRT